MEFLNNLADLDIKAVMIHGRSMAQGQGGPVDWKTIKQARPLVKGILLANGGVRNVEEAVALLKKTGADGIGIGQGALGRPWIFEQLKIKNYELQIKNTEEKSKREIFKVMLKHAVLANKLKSEQGIIEMRKHLCWYVSGLPDASALRQKLIKAESIDDLKRVLK